MRRIALLVVLTLTLLALFAAPTFASVVNMHG